MTNKSPHQSQTTTEDKANLEDDLLAPQRSLTVCTGSVFSVLQGQEKAMWKSIPGHLLSFYHCVLIVYECIYIIMIWSISFVQK